jgi:hypothetical protein
MPKKTENPVDGTVLLTGGLSVFTGAFRRNGYLFMSVFFS